MDTSIINYFIFEKFYSFKEQIKSLNSKLKEKKKKKY